MGSRTLWGAAIAAAVFTACGSASPPAASGAAVDDASTSADGRPSSNGTTAESDASVARDAAAPVDASVGADGDAARTPTDAAASGAEASATADTGAQDGAASTTLAMYVTFYGWDDNSPPGDAIAYPKGDGFPTVHDAAGGTGTFADPITFATDEAELPVGTLVYAPFIEKYLVMEDDCVECDSDWSGSMKRHIDVWMNSDGTEAVASLNACEDQFTQTTTEIMVRPPAGLTVTTNPLFNPTTNTCRSSP